MGISCHEESKIDGTLQYGVGFHHHSRLWINQDDRPHPFGLLEKWERDLLASQGTKTLNDIASYVRVL